MSHLDVAQMIVTNRLAREIEACVKTALLIGKGAFTLYECVRVTLTLGACQPPLLTMMPVRDFAEWELLGKPHEADEFAFFRGLMEACLMTMKVGSKPLVEPGGFSQKACRTAGPKPPAIPEILTWQWTAADEKKEAS
jgi:hypothetical protein